MKSQKEWHVIGRGWCGWHATGINVSSSGGDLLDRPWHAGGIQEGYLAGAVEGALVYDASEADESAFAKFTINGPMVDPALAAPAPFDANGHAGTLAMFATLPNAYGTIATMALGGWSGLDSVPVATYRELLKANVPGVKIGTVQSGAIVWE